MGGNQVFSSGPLGDDSAVPVTLDDARWLSALCGHAAQVQTQATGLITVHPRWSIAPRCLAQHILYLVTDGAVRGRVGERSFVLEPGGLMWIRPKTWHQLDLARPGEPFTMYNLRFRLVLGEEQLGFSRPIHLRRDGWEFQRLVELLFDDLARQHHHRNQRLKSILHLIWTELDADEDRPGQGALNQRARTRLVRYARDHVRAWPSPADLAQVLDLSEDYFRRIFHRSFGLAPRSWLLRERIRLAAMRVADSPQLTLSTIAHDFGYRDLALFSRQFKQVMGCSPRAYRQGR
jgi:AraC-like DNA-binding protein